MRWGGDPSIGDAAVWLPVADAAVISGDASGSEAGRAVLAAAAVFNGGGMTVDGASV